MINACPVCDCATAQLIERRDATPVLLNRLYPSREAARAAPLAPLEFVACASCGFTWNRAFDPDLIVYDADYENDQTHSPTFSAHLEARASDVLAAVPQQSPVNFLEIGCGQGVFLGEVIGAAGARLGFAEGFDPAWRGPDDSGPRGSRIHKVYFDEASASRLTRKPNVAACRHTIEHVPRPIATLSTIRAALGPASRARFFVETPSITWILRNKAVQDLFYEHCSIFTASSLAYALERSGFRVLRVDEVFDGQYLWAEAEASEGVVARPPQCAGMGTLVDVGGQFARNWRAVLTAAAAQGPVAIWGAGAKGVTFSLLVDPDGTLLDHAIDINPAKQNLYLPGSGLAVVSPEISSTRVPSTVLVMNPNYLTEIRAQASAAGINARLVPLD